MSEAKNKDEETPKKDDAKPAGKKTLSLGGTLSLKGGAPAAPRAPSPGTVSVEVRRKRMPAANEKSAAADVRLSDTELERRAQVLKQAQADDGQGKTSLPKRRITIEDKKKEEAANKEAEQSARDKELAELEAIEAQEQKKNADIQQNAPALPDPENASANEARRK